MRRLVVPLIALILLPAYVPAQTRVHPADSTMLSRIAFGSCNRESMRQPLWKLIADKEPQLWIWLGDNIYGDTDNMRVMRAKYGQQLRQPSYREFRRQVPVIGTWDDHDYGLNNGGREYRARAASQQALLDFLDEPVESARRRQEGVHSGEFNRHRVGNLVVALNYGIIDVDWAQADPVIRFASTTTKMQ
ncbi:MAG TPA: alkaline phosphatase D family protein [Longimicrobiales bacterium]